MPADRAIVILALAGPGGPTAGAAGATCLHLPLSFFRHAYACLWLLGRCDTWRLGLVETDRCMILSSHRHFFFPFRSRRNHSTSCFIYSSFRLSSTVYLKTTGRQNTPRLLEISLLRLELGDEDNFLMRTNHDTSKRRHTIYRCLPWRQTYQSLAARRPTPSSCLTVMKSCHDSPKVSKLPWLQTLDMTDLSRLQDPKACDSPPPTTGLVQ